MTFSFGGVGVKIMQHREEFEIEISKIHSLMEAISAQTDKVATLQAELSNFYVEKVYGFRGDLQKFAGAADFGKNLTACRDLIGKIRTEMDVISRMQGECGQAQNRARAALPDCAKWMSNGRLDVPPGGRSFFLAEKGGNVAQIPTSGAKSPVDPRASLGDVQLSRRFQR
jgi:hypothetical protein